MPGPEIMFFFLCVCVCARGPFVRGEREENQRGGVAKRDTHIPDWRLMFPCWWLKGIDFTSGSNSSLIFAGDVRCTTANGQVTLNWWFGLVVWGFEPLALVE